MAFFEQGAPDGAPVVLRIKLRYDSVHAFVDYFALYINRIGIFLRSPTPKPVGTRLLIELHLADNSLVLECEGVVRWIRAFDPKHPELDHGMGIEFLDVTRESLEIIELIEEARAQMDLPDNDKIPRTPSDPADSSTTSAAKEDSPKPNEPSPAPEKTPAQALAEPPQAASAAAQPAPTPAPRPSVPPQADARPAPMPAPRPSVPPQADARPAPTPAPRPSVPPPASARPALKPSVPPPASARPALKPSVPPPADARPAETPAVAAQPIQPAPARPLPRPAEPPIARRAPQPTLDELIAQAQSTAPKALDDGDLEELLTGDVPSLERALARARELARQVNDDELDALLQPTPQAVSDAEEAAWLASIVGSGLGPQRTRTPVSEPPQARTPAPRPAPAMTARPEPAQPSTAHTPPSLVEATPAPLSMATPRIAVEPTSELPGSTRTVAITDRAGSSDLARADVGTFADEEQPDQPLAEAASAAPVHGSAPPAHVEFDTDEDASAAEEQAFEFELDANDSAPAAEEKEFVFELDADDNASRATSEPALELDAETPPSELLEVGDATTILAVPGAGRMDHGEPGDSIEAQAGPGTATTSTPEAEPLESLPFNGGMSELGLGDLPQPVMVTETADRDEEFLLALDLDEPAADHARSFVEIAAGDDRASPHDPTAVLQGSMLDSLLAARKQSGISEHTVVLEDAALISQLLDEAEDDHEITIVPLSPESSDSLDEDGIDPADSASLEPTRARIFAPDESDARFSELPAAPRDQGLFSGDARPPVQGQMQSPDTRQAPPVDLSLDLEVGALDAEGLMASNLDALNAEAMLAQDQAHAGEPAPRPPLKPPLAARPATENIEFLEDVEAVELDPEMFEPDDDDDLDLAQLAQAMPKPPPPVPQAPPLPGMPKPPPPIPTGQQPSLDFDSDGSDPDDKGKKKGFFSRIFNK